MAETYLIESGTLNIHIPKTSPKKLYRSPEAPNEIWTINSLAKYLDIQQSEPDVDQLVDLSEQEDFKDESNLSIEESLAKPLEMMRLACAKTGQYCPIGNVAIPQDRCAMPTFNPHFNLEEFLAYFTFQNKIPKNFNGSSDDEETKSDHNKDSAFGSSGPSSPDTPDFTQTRNSTPTKKEEEQEEEEEQQQQPLDILQSLTDLISL